MLDAELQELARSIHGQAWRSLAARAAELDRTQRFDRDVWTAVGELGLVPLSFDGADGGAGGSALALVVALEQVAYACATAALYPGTTIQVIRALLDHAAPTLRQRWVARLMAGEALAAWAFTEPQTGSDPKQLRTRARRDADGWILDGEKAFISYAAVADVALVFAVTDGGVGAFLAETDQPGWSPGEPIEVLAYGAAEARPVHLDGVRVAPDGLLGEIGNGFDVMLAGEALGKLRVAAINVGVAQRALDEATHYAQQRTHRETPIGVKFPTVQALLADMSAAVLAARAALHETAQRLDAGAGDLAGRVAALRLITARAATEVTSAALQVCGAYGLTRELPLERLYREAKFYEVAQGSLELQRVIAGKAVLARFSANCFEDWRDR
jgi:alkylation response protein AidB-like acyl-CoA dehydrogenase